MSINELTAAIKEHNSAIVADKQPKKEPTVWADCSRYGLQWGRKFSSSINRESGSVIVTRKA